MTIAPDFDPARLERFLGDSVHLDAVSGGQSNPTWFVTCKGQALVLRKKPAGATLDSAHAVDREFRILSALQDSGVPVPRVVRMVDDPAVIGTPFYLMERLDGQVADGSDLPELSARERSAVHLDAARVLARLHALDWRGLGLADYGRDGDYYARQVRRWCGQWAALKARHDPLMDRLSAFFEGNIPPQNPTVIVHGDYRIGNLMYGRDPARIMGVLDWELSTLGDPLADLAHWSMFYDLTPAQMGGLAGLDMARLGLPDRAAFLDAYVAAGGCAAPLTPWHRAFAMFRMAVILEGITARALAGQATSADARAVGALAPDFAGLAEGLLASDRRHL
ncbi:MAG: phosphotransferase family protein [Paracoccaceae bacterium]|nr:phosphotransferase family protein [Paracoccaceae bacterium]